ncbi:hypothetical protein M128_4122 [Bacteroides fragilis str. S6L8]|nr:hypothetical protein M074_3961 [Bacteroides fragilis str. DS-166]EYA03086.1 hypothetical protein M126_4122 [Bacteroides fragilis str. S6L3]EYA07596.1 hypothetical protein M130_4113 [Bacteroides fragilis str. S6R6]EYA98613.1 hypothetical protein M128_4122 [Bacteroides fragilis str. S6L8]EYB03215.1 hypothetical protein M129_4135 [Bacteroides fragilis str. S6R5]EYE43774.1 hypothetical protein M127_4013 [Bacteroides fragilis str. S6L5]EYE49746.1 hypothetical protein M131_3983 [Bacteroides frag
MSDAIGFNDFSGKNIYKKLKSYRQVEPSESCRISLSLFPI